MTNKVPNSLIPEFSNSCVDNITDCRKVRFSWIYVCDTTQPSWRPWFDQLDQLVMLVGDSCCDQIEVTR